MTMASFPEESWACQEPVSENGSLGSESRNLARKFVEFVIFFPLAVMFTKQPLLESRDLRIPSSEEAISSQP